jgi:rRNA-processing protein EBP2
MAKKNKKQRKEKVAASSSGAASEKNKIAPDDENKITWEAVAAMSDSDDDGNDDAGIELNSKAKDLRQAIAEGKFDGLLSKLKADAGDDDEDDFEEDVLDGSSSDEEEQAESGDGKNAEEQSDDSDQEDEDEDRSSENEEEEEDEEDDDRKAPASLKDLVEGNDSDQEGDDKVEMDEEKEDEADDAKMEKYKRLQENNNVSSKALGVVTAELAATHAKMPWAETFVIIPSTPLPFGENGDPEANPLDIHDDLKREVAFYNTALEAVHQAREECKKANVPFSRPDDFFAEMVKTDSTYFVCYFWIVCCDFLAFAIYLVV